MKDLRLLQKADGDDPISARTERVETEDQLIKNKNSGKGARDLKK